MNTLRSLNRYVSLALPDFEVRFAVEEGAFERPYARVAAATPVHSTPRGSHHVELRQAFAITAYPTHGINAESSLLEAARVERLLFVAFAKGIDQASYSARSQRAHPMRVPLFDYTGIGLREAATDVDRIGYLRVLDPPALESSPDPAWDSAYVVTCDLRLGWSESVAPPPMGEIVESVTATPVEVE